MHKIQEAKLREFIRRMGSLTRDFPRNASTLGKEIVDLMTDEYYDGLSPLQKQEVLLSKLEERGIIDSTQKLLTV